MNHHIFWHNHFKRHRMFYGPSRFVWFTIGSVATWAWIHHHHRKHNGEGCPRRVEYNWRDRVDYPGTPAQTNASSSPSPSSPPPPDYAEWQRRQQQHQQQPSEWWRPTPTHPSQSQVAPGGRFDAHVPGSSDVGLNGNGSGPALQREPGVAAAAAAAAAGTVTAAETAFPIDLDAERLRQIGRNAEETINGMSEATIDSVMGALQRLKDRMAERRGQQQPQDTERQQANPSPAPPEEPPRPHHWV